MKMFNGFQKGVNLGGWISQFSEYDTGHFENFITKADIEAVAALGFDHVRVPVDYNVLEDENGKRIERGFGYLKSCREWCASYGLNMLIDLHECYGYSFDPLKKGMDRKKFFYDKDLQERFMKLWEQIAEEFCEYPDQVAFEPLNEVVLFEVKDAWNDLLSRYIAMIRQVSPQSYIVTGGVDYNAVASVPLLDIPLDDRIVYNFHCYEPMIFTHQGAYWMEGMPLDYRIGYPKTLQEYRSEGEKLPVDLGGAVYTEGIREIGEGFFEDIFAPAVEKAGNDGVPLYCSEYGVIDRAFPEDRLRWLKDIHNVFKKYGIGHALWNYKEKDYGMEDPEFLKIRDRFIEVL